MTPLSTSTCPGSGASRKPAEAGRRGNFMQEILLRMRTKSERQLVTHPVRSAAQRGSTSCGFVMHLPCAAFLFAFSFTSVHAQTCGSKYTVTAGDSLSKISRDAYSNATRWSLIYYRKPARIGGDPSLIHPGQELRIPCTDEAETATAPEPAKSDAITTASTRTRSPAPDGHQPSDR